MSDININNEIVNYLSTGARFDVVVYKATASERTFVIVDSPEKTVSEVTINVRYQKHGEIIKTYTITQSALPDFTWSIEAADFADEKALNYWYEAIDENDELLTYGNFELL